MIGKHFNNQARSSGGGVSITARQESTRAQKQSTTVRKKRLEQQPSSEQRPFRTHAVPNYDQKGPHLRNEDHTLFSEEELKVYAVSNHGLRMGL